MLIQSIFIWVFCQPAVEESCEQEQSFPGVLQNRCYNCYLFLIKFQGWNLTTLLKRDTNIDVFLFSTFLRTPFLHNTSSDCFCENSFERQPFYQLNRDIFVVVRANFFTRLKYWCNHNTIPQTKELLPRK